MPPFRDLVLLRGDARQTGATDDLAAILVIGLVEKRAVLGAAVASRARVIDGGIIPVGVGGIEIAQLIIALLHDGPAAVSRPAILDLPVAICIPPRRVRVAP